MINATDYHEYRAKYWADQGGAETYDVVDFHGSCMKDGSKLNAVYLNPKRILFFKDVWHCPDLATAKEVAIRILGFDDVHYLELKGTWVWVDWHHQGKVPFLPGQKTDKRDRYRGR